MRALSSEEEIKRKMLERWLAQQAAQQQAAEQLRKLQEAAELERVKQTILRRILTQDVRDRISNIRLADPDFAEQIENYILMLFQAGRINKVDFETFKQIVTALKSKGP